jgi:hypothetical protein
LLSAPLWNKASNQVGAQFGTSVGTAGDVNGDGYADIIVGSPLWDGPEEDEGQAWVYLGWSGGVHSAPDWYMDVDQEDAQFGYAVGTAGDVNGDGYSDVIVGAPYWEDDVANEGRAWVYLGSASGLLTSHDWHAESNNFTARLGYSVGTAGDVNGDGFSDVIVGAPYYGDGGLSSEGKVWVFHGAGHGGGRGRRRLCGRCHRGATYDGQRFGRGGCAGLFWLGQRLESQLCLERRGRPDAFLVWTVSG